MSGEGWGTPSHELYRYVLYTCAGYGFFKPGLKTGEDDIFCRVWVWKTEQHTPTKISETYP